MANILLTSPCNPSRPHGGAGNEMPSPMGDRLLSWENLIYLADFLLASGQRQVSLGGGEPTRHPECVDFILYLLDRGFDVTLFTHGGLSPSRIEEFRRHLTETPVERLQVVCHLRDPVLSPVSPHDTQRIHSFLAVMGPWTQVGFTIQRVDFTLGFLFDHINRFGLQRQLRLGLAHPVPGSQAGFVPAGDIRRVVERLYTYRQLFETHRVRPDLDCGFPLCRFSDAELGWLHRLRSHAPGGCSPAPEISPDMSVYHCLALASYHRKSLFEFDSLEQLDGHFSRWHEEITAEIAGIYEDCDDCRSREDGGCRGGGMCRIIGRFMDEAPIGRAGVEDGISQDRLPKQ
jgi:hypothetical protein